jgi:hypothetical protein
MRTQDWLREVYSFTQVYYNVYTFCYNALFLWAYSYIVFEIVESRTTDDIIRAETLSSYTHPSYSTTQGVIFLVVMIYQYFTFFVFFMCLEICSGFFTKFASFQCVTCLCTSYI